MELSDPARRITLPKPDVERFEPAAPGSHTSTRQRSTSDSEDLL